MMKPLIGLYQEHTSDLVSTLQCVNVHGYDIMTVPVVHPTFMCRELQEEPMKSRHTEFSRTDVILEPSDWSQFPENHLSNQR